MSPRARCTAPCVNQPGYPKTSEVWKAFGSLAGSFQYRKSSTMASKRDYYEILCVEKTAGAEEIKKAYRKLAFDNHPDRNVGDPEAEERFKEAAEAYEILRDPEKRQRYDRYGHAGLDGMNMPNFNNAQSVFDLFGDLFGD